VTLSAKSLFENLRKKPTKRLFAFAGLFVVLKPLINLRREN
jgi:hypothetical protein